MNKTLSLAIFGLFCGVQPIAWSQNAASHSFSTAPLQEAAGVSLAALLQLQPAQSQRFERLHDELVARTRIQESKIAVWQEQRASASPLDARRAASLDRDISAGQRKIEADWAAARAKARQMLPPVQRSQLDSVASDARFRVRPDRISGLLMAPKGAVARLAAPDGEARRNWLDARRLSGQSELNRAAGVGSYGVYGGYGYGGPQVGVYGGYQQGAVGVHGGIGLGGPSIGISIGRVFGVGRR